MQNRFNRVWLVPISLLILIGLYYFPPIHSRLAWRLESLRTQLRYMVKPPEEASKTWLLEPFSLFVSTLAVNNAPVPEKPAATSTSRWGRNCRLCPSAGSGATFGGGWRP